jgi:hypothetical protein
MVVCCYGLAVTDEHDWGQPVKGPSPWTVKRVSRLRDLVASGIGPTAISVTMNLSKNQVTGKMRRLGLIRAIIYLNKTENGNDQ